MRVGKKKWVLQTNSKGYLSSECVVFYTVCIKKARRTRSDNGTTPRTIHSGHVSIYWFCLAFLLKWNLYFPNCWLSKMFDFVFYRFIIWCVRIDKRENSHVHARVWVCILRMYSTYSNLSERHIQIRKRV